MPLFGGFPFCPSKKAPLLLQLLSNRDWIQTDLGIVTSEHAGRRTEKRWLPSTGTCVCVCVRVFRAIVAAVVAVPVFVVVLVLGFCGCCGCGRCC